MTTTIIGAGSGGGKGGGNRNRTPKTDRDSLDSREFANITEVISEGEIEGLANELQSVFLNNTAVQNADGTYNFQDVDVYYDRTGTADQDVIPLSSSTNTTRTIQVNRAIPKEFPITETITDPDVDAVRLTITVPVLQKINNKNGDTLGTRVELKIEVKYINADNSQSDWIRVIGGTDDEEERKKGRIRGRTADAYNREYEIKFDKTRYPNAANYQIRITKLTDDGDNHLTYNDISLSYYVTVKYGNQKYNNTALIGIRIDAQQFSSIPSRKYDVKGLKVQIPTGVTVDSDTGRIIYPTNFLWDGTFQAATWTSCPAWLLYALMLNKRFGLGDHFDSTQLDKWAFFRASKYANELITYQVQQGDDTEDVSQVSEARFSCNGTISSTEEAYNLINQLLSVMRCQGFWQDGGLTIVQDSPSDPIYNFNQANVTEEGFSYTNGSSKNKPTVVVVAYLDVVAKERAYVTVKDTDGITKRGVIKKSITAFCCTSKAQAHRLGKWLLYEDKYGEIVAFTSNLVTAQLLQPGQIISISDPVKGGTRRAGRIKSATINSIVIDDKGDASNIPTSQTPTLSVVLPDGTFDANHEIVEVDYVYCVTDYWITGYTSDSGRITIADNFQAIPDANSIWVVESTDLQTSLWRVLGIKEEKDFLYTIEAVYHNESKYEHIESGETLIARDTTNLNVIPDAPSDVLILDNPRTDGTTTKELQYELNGKIAVKITFHWRGVLGVDRYKVRWRHEDDNFITQIINGTTIDLMDVKVGMYFVEVSSIARSGLLFSSPATGNYSVTGLRGNPDDITGLSLVPISETLAVLSWNEISLLDVKLGGRIIIRHDPRTVGATWLSSNKIVDGVSGASTQKQVPLLPGTYFIKAQDYLGNKSTNAASFVATLPETVTRLNVKTWSEETAFSGTKVNTKLVVSAGKLVLTTDPYIDEIGYVEPLYVNGDEKGEYIYATTFDFGHAGVQYDAVLRKEVISTSVATVGDLWNDRFGNFDTASGTFDGQVFDAANVDLFVRTTSDDPSSPSATWGDWAEFEAAIIRARGIEIKAAISTTSYNANVSISDLGSTLELLGRTESRAVTSDGQLPPGSGTVDPYVSKTQTGIYVITFEKAFYDNSGTDHTPQVQITPNASNSTRNVSITNLSRTGFTATFKDGSSNVDTDFMYTVTGFGRAV